MKSDLLFPRYFKIIGWVLALPGLVLEYLFIFQRYTIPFLSYGERASDPYARYLYAGQYNLTDELAVTLSVIGLIFIGFSKLKQEDWVISKIRLTALFWAVLVNCIWVYFYLLALSFADFAHINFFSFDVFTCNVITPLLIFILRFMYLRYRYQKGKRTRDIHLFLYKPYGLFGVVGSIGYFILGIVSIIEPFRISIPQEVFIGLPPILLLWLWSRAKNENKHVAGVRFKAMQTAIYINYCLFLIAEWTMYGPVYSNVQFGSLVSVQIIFIIIFYYQLYWNQRTYR